MPKPSDPEAQPRRDGFLERVGTWGEVTVGSVIASSLSRTRRWEIIATANPGQIEYGHTLWFRMRDQVTGEEVSVKPRPVSIKVVFLMSSDEEVPPPVTPAHDADQIALLVEKLGAQEIATRDHETGEIHCPDYSGPGAAPGGIVAELEHLRICHGLDTSGLEAITNYTDRDREVITTHGRLHGRNAATIMPGGKGFPHRHVPEDRTMF